MLQRQPMAQAVVTGGETLRAREPANPKCTRLREPVAVAPRMTMSQLFRLRQKIFEKT
jgi:hypothetical protein